jgi:hypothetical protein
VRHAWPLLALLFACDYQELELSRCWPDCGSSSSMDGGDGEEDLGLSLSIVWVTPHNVALEWPNAVPADLERYALSVGGRRWDQTWDPRLADRSTTQTTVSGLNPGESHLVVLRGIRSGGASVVVARGNFDTPVEPAGAVVLYAEGEAPPRTGFVLNNPPSTHAGTGALWFDADTLGQGDAPALTGLNTNVAGLIAARDTAYLELWIRVLPDGGGVVPLTTRLVAGGLGHDCDQALAPIQAGWHRLQVPLRMHRREGGNTLDLSAGTITGLALEATWPAGATIIVDDLRLRY